MAHTIETMQAEVKSKPDEVRTFEKGRIELFNVGGKTVGRGTFEPGWKWSTHVKPIAGTESCQSDHLGYVIAGRMHIKVDDGHEYEFLPGESLYLPPGHDAWVVGDEPCVVLDFQGYEDYAKPSGSRTQAQKPQREGRKH